MKYKIDYERTLVSKGTIEVEADTKEDAEELFYELYNTTNKLNREDIVGEYDAMEKMDVIGLKEEKE